jgi:hypothetical protein
MNSNTSSCRPIGSVSHPLMENSIKRVPAVETAEIIQLLNGPEGFTPTASSCWGPPPSKAFGWPAPSAPTAWPGQAASARSWPSGSSMAPLSTMSGGWMCAALAPTTTARIILSSAPSKPTRSTTTSTSPARSVCRDAACASPPLTTACASWVPSSARRPAGSAPTT